jgi:hypothetical protein
MAGPNADEKVVTETVTSVEATPSAVDGAQQTAPLPVRDPRFQAAMPAIPGVPRGARSQLPFNIPPKQAAMVLGGFLLLILASVWIAGRGPRMKNISVEQTAPNADVTSQNPQMSAAQAPSTNQIGPLEDFARPWAAKKFIYTSLLGHVSTPAIAIRLPIGDGHTSASYWAISLKAPYGQCDLEYMTDENAIAQKFGYRATHPMIVDACGGILYDPMRTATLPNGLWARGEIVQGTGLRPPLEVEILVQGDTLVAGRSED